MTDLEKYEFDRQGFLIVKNLLSPEQVRDLTEAVDEVEAHALHHTCLPPRKMGPKHKNMEYHRNEERGYHVVGSAGEGKTMVIEDFFNTSPAFDFLVNHEPTMGYINDLIQEDITINNSEIRLRYTGNATGSHMGGPISYKYRYGANERGLDCMMVRMVYFLHDVAVEDGAFCVVPGTHKTHWPPPYGSNPETEPGMVGLEVKAGEGILFTEHLRHGGLPNRSEKPVKRCISALALRG